MVIKWTNVFSGEVGYVKSIDTKECHFVNTFDKAEAKQYKTASAAKSAITRLINYGEGTHNAFEIVE